MWAVTRAVHLDLIGDGSARPEIERFIAEQRLEPYVTLHGFLRIEQAAPILGRSEIGLSPYCGRVEYSGLKLLDYKAAGLATIASGEGGEPAVLQHGRTGWIVPPCDVDRLAEALVTLCDDAPLRRCIGQAARAEAEAEHSWRHTAVQLQDNLRQGGALMSVYTTSRRRAYDRSGRLAEAAGMVSFVIPNYNHARYLGQAIASALAQTYPNVEVIVVDDGSTDDSRAVAAAFGDRIRYIYQQNAGLSAARNTGVRAAQGEYIALLDADDLVEPAYAERLLAALAEAPQAAGAYCGFRFVDQDNRPLNRVEQRIAAPEALYGALLNGNYWVPESLLARRSCYQAHGRV